MLAQLLEMEYVYDWTVGWWVFAILVSVFLSVKYLEAQ